MSDYKDHTRPDIKLENTFINNLPEHYRDHQNVDEMFHALGTYLDELRTEINQFQFYHDWARNTDENLIYLSEQYGVNLPRNLSRNKRKLIVRDVINFYKFFGTEAAIRLLFRLIGWDVEFEYIFVNSETESIEYIYPSDYFFGKDYVDDSGYIRADVTDPTGERISNARVYGESYPQSLIDEQPLELIRCPYFKVTITAEDYGVFTEDYTDGDGNTYSYTETERFEIIQNIINYFRDVGRPANVAIIELATPFNLDDAFIYQPQEVLNLENNPEEVYAFPRTLRLDEGWVLDVEEMDTWAYGNYFGGLTLDETDSMYMTRDPDVFEYEWVISSGSIGETYQKPARYNMELEFQEPSSFSIDLLTTEEYNRVEIQSMNAEFSTLDTIQEPQTVTLTGKRAFKLNIKEELDNDLKVVVRYLKPSGLY